MLDGDGESDTSSQDNSGFQDDIDEDPSTHLLQLLLLHNQQMGQIMMDAIIIVAKAVVAAAKKAQCIPYHTSILTGKMWVLELLNGHPDQIAINWVFRRTFSSSSLMNSHPMDTCT